MRASPSDAESSMAMTPPPALFWMTQASKLWSASRRRSGLAQILTVLLGIEVADEVPGIAPDPPFLPEPPWPWLKQDALWSTTRRTRLAEIAQGNDQVRHVVSKLQRLFEQGSVIRRRAFSHQPQLNAAAQCGHGLSQAVSHRPQAFAALGGSR